MRLTIRTHTPAAALPATALLVSLWLAFLSAAGLSRYILWTLPCLLGLLALIPTKRLRRGLLLVMAALVFGALFLPPVSGGVKLLLNSLYAASESCQSYEYDYFTVSSGSMGAALALLSALTGLGCAAWKKAVVLPLSGVLALSFAYLGIAPRTGYLLAVLALVVLCLLPSGCFWQRSAVALGLLAVVTLAVLMLAPAQSPAVSNLDETLRDALAIHSIFYAESPAPETQTETKEQTAEEPQLPDEALQPPKKINTLFLVLTGLTLLVLFVPAVWRDRLQKRREKARAGINSPDCAEAIVAMYLYTQKWRRQAGENAPQSAQAVELFELAAYSDHPLREAQRYQMKEYMTHTVTDIYGTLSRRERLRVRFVIGL